MLTVRARISPTATAAMAVIAPLSGLDAILEIVYPSVIVALVAYTPHRCPLMSTCQGLANSDAANTHIYLSICGSMPQNQHCLPHKMFYVWFDVGQTTVCHCVLIRAA